MSLLRISEYRDLLHASPATENRIKDMYPFTADEAFPLPGLGVAALDHTISSCKVGKGQDVHDNGC